MQEPQKPNECCAGLSEEVRQWRDAAARSMREDPVKTVGLAAVAGLLITALPVGSLLAALTRLAFGLLRPALIVLGVVKVAEEISKRSKH